MRSRFLVAGVMALLALALVFARASAGDWLYNDAALNSWDNYLNTNVREVNVDPYGYVYLSDPGSGSIWRINSYTDESAIYDTWYPVTDAKPDPQGMIWWTDRYDTFGRLNPKNREITLWSIDPKDQFFLWGLAIDEYGRVWMPTWYESTGGTTPGYMKLYRFGPNNSQLCYYVVAGGDQGTYILYQKPYLWFGTSSKNIQEARIYRFNPSTGSLSYWIIGNELAYPRGITMDVYGNLWWANPSLRRLVRFEPGPGALTIYPLPDDRGDQPQMVAAYGNQIWYSELSYPSIGILNPQSPDIHTIPEYVTPVEGTIGLGPCIYPPYVEGGAGGIDGIYMDWTPEGWYKPAFDDGVWKVFQLPEGSSPYGIASVSGEIWAADTYRQKLMRFAPIYTDFTYLSLVMR